MSSLEISVINKLHFPLALALPRQIRCSSLGKAAIVLFLIGACVLLASCSGGATVWSAQVKSPDATWIASARTVQYGGPGNAGLYTYVYLNAKGSSRSPVMMLLFDDEYVTPGNRTHVKMTWVTQKHLEIAYKSGVTIEYQAIKYSGIDVSVKQVK